MNRLLFKIFRPIEILVGKIHAPFSDRLIKGDDFYGMQFDLRPGDIVLTRIRWHMTNLFIPGFWKHAAIVSKDLNIIEATAEGVHKTNLFDFVSTKDHLIVLRLKTLNKAIALNAALNAEALVGSKYDYEFETTDKEYYCSELVSISYQNVDIELVKTNKVFGMQEILPTSFHESLKLEQIFMSTACAKKLGKIQ